MPIDKLNLHFSFTNPASIHDEEALTALELAGRQGAKINEVVEDQNNLRTETEKHLSDQDTDIDQRLSTQDQNIENIRTVTVPADVKKEVDRHIKAGTFAEAIDTYAGGVQARVDNLFTKVKNGSTTLDAEVIDSRVDMFNVAHPSAGSAFRSMVNYLTNMLSYISQPVKHRITVEAISGYIKKTGEVAATPEGSHYIYVMLPVNEGEVYEIYSQYGGILANALAFDVNGELLMLFNEKDDYGTKTDTIVIPEGCVTLGINSISVNNFKVYQIDNYAPDPAHQINLIDNLIASGSIDFRALCTPAEIVNSSVLKNGKLIAVEPANSNYKVYKYQVEPGTICKITATTGYTNVYYQVRTAAGETLEEGESYVSADGSPLTNTITKLVIAPQNAAEIWVSWMFNEGGLLHGISSTVLPLKWSGINWACIGDSLTERNTRSPKFYHDYVHEASGINAVNMGLSGSGYKRREDEGKAFYQRVVNLPENADVVTIFGSGNDLTHIDNLGEVTDTTADTICGCVNLTIDAIYAKLPAVQLGIVSPTPWQNNQPENNGTMSRYVEKLEAICKRRGIPYLDLFHRSGLRPNEASYRALVYSNDDGAGVHPNEIGHKIISSHFMAFLESLVSTF